MSYTKPLGTLKPLEISEHRWGALETDFITHLPETNTGYNLANTILNCLIKKIHLLSAKETNTAEDVAKSSIENVFKLHELSDTNVSDRGPKLTSRFWWCLTALYKIGLKMPTSRPPQTNVARGIMNQIVGNFIPCHCSRHQRDWDELLAPAKFAYNSSTVESMSMKPVEAVLGRTPRSPLETMKVRAESSNQLVNDQKVKLEESLKDAIIA